MMATYPPPCRCLDACPVERDWLSALEPPRSSGGRAEDAPMKTVRSLVTVTQAPFASRPVLEPSQGNMQHDLPAFAGL